LVYETQTVLNTIKIERNIVFRFTSKNHNSLFHPYRNHQVVNKFEIVGCFYAIERMCGMRVGETMLRRNSACLGH
jgi:hypothetical protein